MARISAIAIPVAALATFMLPAQAQVQQVWVRHHAGSGGMYDWGADIVADRANNVIVSGVTEDAAQIADILTIKYAPDGTELWVRRYDGPASGHDNGSAVAVDAGGNVFVAGYSFGSTSGRDLVTLAYDPAGNPLWVQRYDGPSGGDDEALDLVVDSAGRIYVTGTSAGAGTGTDLVLLAYDPSGSLLWERRYDGPASGDDGGQAIELHGSNGLVVAGFAALPGQDTDYLTIACDLAGNPFWERTYDGPVSGEDKATDLVVDASGNVLVTGGSEESLGGQSFLTTTLKYDALGTLLWAQRVGSVTNGYRHRTIGVDAGANVYVAGAGWTTHVTVKFDPAGALLWERSPDLSDAEAYELVVDDDGNSYVVGSMWTDAMPGGSHYGWLTLAYDPDGYQVWSAKYDAPPTGSWDFGLAIALDSTGRVLVTGLSEQTIYIPDCTTIVYETDCDCSIKTYCTAKANSLGCTPTISMANAPSTSKGWGCTISAVNLIPKRTGLFFHGTTGQLAQPFHGGLLCVGPTVRRHPPSSTSGVSGSCTGSLTEDLNTYIAAGKDPALVPGATIYLQAWSRDPGDPWLDSLSDAVQAVICP